MESSTSDQKAGGPPPRRTGVRLGLSVVLIVAAYGGSLLVTAGVNWVVGTIVGVSPWSPSLDRLANIVGWASLSAIYGWLAPKVSYRRHDFLLLLVPVWGIYWSFKVMWRLAYLPHCDWDIRPDEVSTIKLTR